MFGHLQCLINKLPQQWKISYITSRYTKCRRKDSSNNRALSVTCILSKLSTSILKPSANQIINEDKSSFTSGRGCVEINQQLLVKKTSTNEETHMAFIDRDKAYESISPEIYLEKVLLQWHRSCNSMGIPINDMCLYNLFAALLPYLFTFVKYYLLPFWRSESERSSILWIDRCGFYVHTISKKGN